MVVIRGLLCPRCNVELTADDCHADSFGTVALQCGRCRVLILAVGYENEVMDDQRAQWKAELKEAIFQLIRDRSPKTADGHAAIDQGACMTALRRHSSSPKARG